MNCVDIWETMALCQCQRLEANEYTGQGDDELGKCQQKMWRVFSFFSKPWLYLQSISRHLNF